MISYNQKASGNIAKELAMHLKESKVKVWIDFDDMKGNILDAMANAVAGGFFILVLCV